jgi:hypothetical protein
MSQDSPQRRSPCCHRTRTTPHVEGRFVKRGKDNEVDDSEGDYQHRQTSRP